mgnify:CR=1 FL=1|tara:strand:+ start:8089 stop:8505 length:417 start_codon:yes stop_codon:yes gene_type:complete
MKRLIAVTALSLCLSACTTTPRAYLTNSDSNLFYGKSDKEIVDLSKKLSTIKFKDPSSAQFRNMRVATVSEERNLKQSETIVGLVEYVCVEVNGKNSYGGYTGFSETVIFGDGTSLDSTYSRSFCSYGNKEFRSLSDL